MKPWLVAVLIFPMTLSAPTARAQPVPAPFTAMPRLESLRSGPMPRLVPVTVVLAAATSPDGPMRILRLVRSGRRWPAWRLAEVTDVTDGRSRVVLRGLPGEQTLLVWLDGGPGYVLDGPFHWPGRQQGRRLDARRRRTLEGALPIAGASLAFAWVSAERLPEAGPWPDCGTLPEGRWECIGVPWDEAGVLLLSSGPPVRFAVARLPAPDPATGRLASGPSPVGAAAWCRLLRVVSPAAWAPIDPVTVEPRRPRARRAGRLRFEPDARVTVEALGPNAFWICGTDEPIDGVLHIEGGQVATTDVVYDGWQQGPPELSHEILLDPPVHVAGRVEDAHGDPAAGTLVVVSRIDSSDPPAGRADARRPEYVAEVVAAEDGTFEVPGLREGRYEFAGLHPASGRVTAIVELDGKPVVLRLVPSRRVRGRVLREGQPVAGVIVGVAPDLTSYMSGVDAMDLVSFSALTDAAGRFDVAVPPAGTGVVRIGADDTGVVRVPLGPVDQLPAVVDLGDIELPSPIRLVIEVDGAGRCDLRAAGPFGSSGLTVVPGIADADGRYVFRLPESGRWVLSLTCGGREVRVVPPIVEVPAGDRDAHARVAARTGG